MKEQTKTSPGQAKFKSYLSQGQAGIQLFFLSPEMGTGELNDGGNPALD